MKISTKQNRKNQKPIEKKKNKTKYNKKNKLAKNG